MFRAVWQHERPDFQHLESLGACHNDGDSYQPDFRHLATAYERYIAKPDALAESPKDRAVRLARCTRFLGAVISAAKGEYKVRLAFKDVAAYCKASHSC